MLQSTIPLDFAASKSCLQSNFLSSMRKNSSPVSNFLPQIMQLKQSTWQTKSCARLIISEGEIPEPQPLHFGPNDLENEHFSYSVVSRGASRELSYLKKSSLQNISEFRTKQLSVSSSSQLVHFRHLECQVLFKTFKIYRSNMKSPHPEHFGTVAEQTWISMSVSF